MSFQEISTELNRMGVYQEMLKFLGAPRTIDEVAEHFDWHPQTAREKVWELQRMGKVNECVRKRGRQKLWQTIATIGEPDRLVVTSSQKSELLVNLAVNTHNQRRALGDVIGGCLAYLWRRAYYKEQDQSNVLNVAKQGSLDPLIHVKVLMEKVWLQHVHYMEALQTLLVEHPELWNDSGAILKLIGKVEPETIESYVGDFEAWAYGILNQQP